MFGLIRKKNVEKELKELQSRNKKKDLGANYDRPVSNEQAEKNKFAQTWEDATDNAVNYMVYWLHKK